MWAFAWTQARANPTLAALALLSVVALAIGLERLFSTLAGRRRLAHSRQGVLEQLRHGGANTARAALNGGPAHLATPPLALLLAASSEHDGDGPGRARAALGRAYRLAHRRLWLLGSIGAMAPFIGLFGTVLGVMDAFRAIGENGAGGFEVVSQGLSEALVTTAAGIFVAIEAIALFNALKVLVGDYAWELRDTFEQVRAAVGRHSGGHAGP